MIHVPRTLPAPGCLVGEESAGAKETKEAIAHYESDAAKAFDGYGAYKSPEVRRALEELFHGKCAYCEVGYDGAPRDIDHFRPKAAVVEVDPVDFRPLPRRTATSRGYYWLAATWSNLLLACIHCNRPEGHRADGRHETLGKSNYFPLEPGSPRARDPRLDPEVVERRLLLDPCRDQPERHLEFAPKGIIRARRTAAGLDPRGVASIRVYGLRRDELMRAREKTETMLRDRILDAKLAARELKADPGDARARGALQRAFNQIQRDYLAPDAPFLGMSRQLVRQELARTIQALEQRHAGALAATAATIAASAAITPARDTDADRHPPARARGRGSKTTRSVRRDRA